MILIYSNIYDNFNLLTYNNLKYIITYNNIQYTAAQYVGACVSYF